MSVNYNKLFSRKDGEDERIQNSNDSRDKTHAMCSESISLKKITFIRRPILM
jgi:hypothetical protein